MKNYLVRRSNNLPELNADWYEPAWRDVPPLLIDQFHPNSSDHRPGARAKLLYSGDALHVIFRVLDRYVVCKPREYQGPVCRDSCVEIFLQPDPARGYFNFEFNCGGDMLLFYIQNPTPKGEFFEEYQAVPLELARNVLIRTTLPRSIPTEMTDDIEWRLEATIPLSIFRSFVPEVQFERRLWRANLYKCASESSHPHWASWSPIGAKLNFHQPQRFGALAFQSE